MIERIFASLSATDYAEHLQSQLGIETAQLERMREWKENLSSLNPKARYRAKNRALLRHKHGMRRAAELNAIPIWLTKNQERQILRQHEKAVEKEFWSRIPHDVHHSVPLHGKDSTSGDDSACGLHVPWNLEVLTREENLQLGARYDEEYSMPF